MNKNWKKITSLDYSHEWVTDPEHLIALYEVTRTLPKPIDALEIGTFYGHAAYAMYLAGARVVTVDVDEHPKVFPNTLGINFQQMSGEEILEECFFWDIIWHDSNHGEEMIPEFQKAWSKVKSGGVLAIHDVNEFNRYQLIDTLSDLARYVVLIDRIDRMTLFAYKTS